MLSEVSQTEMDKYFIITYMWNLNIQQIWIEQRREADSQIQKTNQWLPAGRGKGQGGKWQYRNRGINKRILIISNNIY